MNGRRKCECGQLYSQYLVSCPSCDIAECFSTFIPYDVRDWIYDLETYPNIFTASFKHVNTGSRILFEISDRKNELVELVTFLQTLKDSNSRLVGFNNIGFDYPIIHYIIQHYPYVDIDSIYHKAASIINTPWERRFDNIIWDNDRYIEQIDLFKIHHFDNEARRTSLKLLEFNMRSDSIEDLPFEPGTPLTIEQIPVLITYNDHDVDETEKFYIKSLDQIELREDLSERYGRNFINHSDKKIGTEYFIMRLEQDMPGSCYMMIDGKRHPRQTNRSYIDLGEVIFPYIKLRPEFERVRQWLSTQRIIETKGIFSELSAVVDGFKYDFGTGGIHGSVESQTIYTDDEYIIYDWDVASYYPNIAIANRLYPEHLSERFCDIYEDVYNQRKQFAKGTPENAMFKLALNGVYGDSNNKYSSFYDPKYTLSITINGQLLLCMLAQHLIELPGLSMLQINTDGLTVKCPRNQVEQMKAVCKWWEQFTCLTLEPAIYKRMFIRDVNNYIAEYEDGKVKRKGAYEYKLEWHQNHSSLIIPKAAEAALVHGEDIEQFIKQHDDIFDFMLRTKVGRKDKLMLNGSIQLQNITRYYIAKQGGTLSKISPPVKGAKVGQWKRANGLTDAYYDQIRAELRQSGAIECGVPGEYDVDGLNWDSRINTKNKSKYEQRETSFNAGWLVAPCNNIKDARWDNINYDYYIAEAKKLVEVLK